MAVSLYEISVPAFERALTAFLAVLDKAEAHAAARKFDPVNYLGLRLAPDQFTLTRQIQTFCDHAKNASFRLSGAQPPFVEDREGSLEELRARIRATLDMLKAADASSIDAAAGRDVVFPVGPGRKVGMRAELYLVHFALPNFYFHLTTAYDILRAAGVEIGKRDFLGALPGATPA
jgi:hypothetical protein